MKISESVKICFSTFFMFLFPLCVFYCIHYIDNVSFEKVLRFLKFFRFIFFFSLYQQVKLKKYSRQSSLLPGVCILSDDRSVSFFLFKYNRKCFHSFVFHIFKNNVTNKVSFTAMHIYSLKGTALFLFNKVWYVVSIFVF